MIKLQGRSQIIIHDEVIVLLRHDRTPTWVDGKLIEPTEQRIEIKANVQPLLGRDLLIVPEADRTKEQLYVWSESPIMLNDKMVRQGVNFQAQSIENWGSYFRARMMRIDVGKSTSN